MKRFSQRFWTINFWQRVFFEDFGRSDLDFPHLRNPHLLPNLKDSNDFFLGKLQKRTKLFRGFEKGMSKKVISKCHLSFSNFFQIKTLRQTFPLICFVMFKMPALIHLTTKKERVFRSPIQPPLLQAEDYVLLCSFCSYIFYVMFKIEDCDGGFYDVLVQISTMVREKCSTQYNQPFGLKQGKSSQNYSGLN